VYVPVPDYVAVPHNQKIRTSLYIKQKMLILGRVATKIDCMKDLKRLGMIRDDHNMAAMIDYE
jgi:hypothetical protein